MDPSCTGDESCTCAECAEANLEADRLERALEVDEGDVPEQFAPDAMEWYDEDGEAGYFQPDEEAAVPPANAPHVTAYNQYIHDYGGFSMFRPGRDGDGSLEPEFDRRARYARDHPNVQNQGVTKYRKGWP